MFLLDGHRRLTMCRAIADQAGRMRRLADDLQRIADEDAPTDADLRDAPMLGDWAFARRTAICLTGLGVGHPHLPDGPIWTSDLWVVDPAGRWARTSSRFYVLSGHSPAAERFDA